MTRIGPRPLLYLCHPRPVNAYARPPWHSARSVSCPRPIRRRPAPHPARARSHRGRGGRWTPIFGVAGRTPRISLDLFPSRGRGRRRGRRRDGRSPPGGPCRRHDPCQRGHRRTGPGRRRPRHSSPRSRAEGDGCSAAYEARRHEGRSSRHARSARRCRRTEASWSWGAVDSSGRKTRNRTSLVLPQSFVDDGPTGWIP